jgi:hypothetical protein
MFYSPRSLLFVLLIPVLASACARNPGIPVYPVSGIVLHNGEPAEGALVICYPVNPIKVEKEAQPPRPSGLVDASGEFVLSTNAPGDGAREGDYRVSIVWFKDATGEEPVFGGRGKEGQAANKDYLNGKYSDPKRSGLTITVSPGSNQLDPFELD